MLRRLAVDALHGDEDAAIVQSDVIDGHDGVVGEPRDHAPLMKGISRGAGLVNPMEQLDGDLALQLRIVGGEFRAHTAFADRISHQ